MSAKPVLVGKNLDAPGWMAKTGDRMRQMTWAVSLLAIISIAELRAQSINPPKSDAFILFAAEKGNTRDGITEVTPSFGRYEFSQVLNQLDKSHYSVKYFTNSGQMIRVLADFSRTHPSPPNLNGISEYLGGIRAFVPTEEPPIKIQIIKNDTGRIMWESEFQLLELETGTFIGQPDEKFIEIDDNRIFKAKISCDQGQPWTVFDRGVASGASWKIQLPKDAYQSGLPLKVVFIVSVPPGLRFRRYEVSLAPLTTWAPAPN